MGSLLENNTMTNQPNIHWTRDTELLEQFVMHRLDDARRKELEAHLLTCEGCQRAVKDEQVLVLGMKRVGRDAMKARLRERLAAGQAPLAARKIPWMQITSAAAVVILVVGLGIYNKWIPFGTEKDEFAGDAAQPQPVETLAKAPEVNQEKAGKAEESKPTEESRSREADQLRDRTDDKAAQLELERRVAEAAPSAAGAAAKKDEVAVNELTDADTREKKLAAQGVWVEGVVIPEQSTDDLKRAMPQTQLLQSQQAARLMQKANTTAVTVTEMPVEELPPTQQMRQQRLDNQTVQTMIEQQDGNLNFVLFRQAPQQKLKSHAATLEQVGNDSLIITVGNERIGYNIQGGLDALQQTKQAKTKK